MSETAYFAAGCFWGAELAFSKISGVIATEVGFSEIKMSNGKQSKVETVKVDFNPSDVSYPELIDTFWSTHNASSKQHESETYVEKSVLFGIDDHQLNQAETGLNDKKKNEKDPIYTVVQSFMTYIKAPEKDQKYYFKEK